MNAERTCETCRAGSGLYCNVFEMSKRAAVESPHDCGPNRVAWVERRERRVGWWPRFIAWFKK